MNERLPIRFPSQCAVVVLLWLAAVCPRAELAAADPGYTTVVVTTNGLGSVWPDYNGRRLKVGSWLFPKVQPGPGQIFAGWTSNVGDCIACNAFNAAPGLELCAHFVPNPFLALQGDYAGLFVDTNGTAGGAAGYVTLHLTSHGDMRVKVRMPGHSCSLEAGPYDLLETSSVIHGWRYDLLGFTGSLWDESLHQVLHASVPLLFDAPAEVVQGTVDNAQRDSQGVTTPATWTAQMVAYHAEFDSRTNPAPQAGAYTLLLPATGDAGIPAGCGFAAVAVKPGGQVSVSGFLADGAPLAQGTTLAQNGSWPLYAAPYGGRGSVTGWVGFTNLAGADGGGAIVWTRLARPTSAGHPAGFTNAVSALVQRWVRPAASTQILGYTNGILVLEGYAPGLAITNHFRITPSGRVENTGSYRFNLAFTPVTGLFAGTFQDPVSRKVIPFRGAVSQGEGRGYGYFLDANQHSGLVLISPAP